MGNDVLGMLENGLFGNSRLEYSPPLGMYSAEQQTPESSTWIGVARTTRGLQAIDGAALAFASFDISSPWVICGGNVTATFANFERSLGDETAQKCAIDVTVDG